MNFTDDDRYPMPGPNDAVVWQGDCRELLARIPDGSIDVVVTDPPYGINFRSRPRWTRSQRAAFLSALRGSNPRR
jgi:DNA modification methylase